MFTIIKLIFSGSFLLGGIVFTIASTGYLLYCNGKNLKFKR